MSLADENYIIHSTMKARKIGAWEKFYFKEKYPFLLWKKYECI